MTKKKNSPVFDIKITTYSLSIQLSLNGFSFCITTNEGEIVTSYNELAGESAFTEHQLLQKITALFENKPELQAEFAKITAIYHNELFALVPEPAFDKNELSTYLNYSVKTLPTDYITYDNLNSGIINVFIPYVNVNNFLIDKFGEFDFHHSSGILINHVITKEHNSLIQKIHLYVSENQFDLIINKGNKLLLFNSFKYQTNEDVLYYLLFCLEQLNLSPNDIKIKLLNHIPEKLFDLLYTYVRNIKNENREEISYLVLHKIALQ